MLDCSRTGTYALPRFTSTLLPSISSGTFSKSTLNHDSSSTRRNPGVAATSSAAKSLFSSSPTTSQSNCRLFTNASRSLMWSD